MFNAANFSIAPWYDSGNYGDFVDQTVTATRLNMFLCPSDTPPSYDIFVIMDYHATAPGDSYFASIGSSLDWNASDGGSAPNGIFAYLPANSGTTPVTLAGITDGTSNTVAFGEWRIGTGNANMTSPQDIALAAGLPPGCGGELPAPVDGSRRARAFSSGYRFVPPPSPIVTSTPSCSVSTGPTASIAIPWAPCSCRPIHSIQAAPTPIRSTPRSCAIRAAITRAVPTSS